MNKKAYSGAYSRRFSNYTGSNKETNGSVSSVAGTYSLSVTSGEPAMGEAGYIKLANHSPLSSQAAEEPSVSNRGGFVAGTEFRAVAKANPGYRFIQWQTNIDGVGNTSRNPLEFALTKDTWLIARFEKTNTASTSKTVNVTWDGQMGRVNGNGLVLSDEGRAGSGQITAAQGSTVTLTASPLNGFHFVKWHGAPVDGKTSSTVTFQVNNNYTIRAEFAPDSATPDNGGGTGNGGNGNGGAENVSNGNVAGEGTVDRVKAFVKKWWWAILIVAYIIYKERKGGSK
jgi:hypothetical protein